jgi:hypothetical protein
MAQGGITYEERRREAFDRYDNQVAFYERTKTDARRRYYALQVLVIVGSTITSVLILADAPKWMQGAAPAVAIIAASCQIIWQFKESWLRRAWALESLKRERILFDTRSGKRYAAPVSDDQAVERFILRAEDIYARERGEWRRSRVQKGKQDGKQGATPSSS